MKVAFFLCAILTITLLRVFPGEGPGFQDHPEGFAGVVGDRLSYYWMAETEYIWLKGQCSDHFTYLVDWCMDGIFVEKVRAPGLDPRVIEELRQKRLKAFGDLVTLMIMIAGCGWMIRNALKKSFYEELKSPKRNASLKRQSTVSRGQEHVILVVSLREKKSKKQRQRRR